MTLPPRFDVTAAEIDHVVAQFYAAARLHPVLGPIFAAHVTDWPAHEDKIGHFWRNAILFERVYDGNPMQIHMQAHGVEPAHFDLWLELFDRVLAEALPAPNAAAWSQLAHRIGRGLRFGLEPQNAATPPNLRLG